ncbi:hypothetical protein J6590_059111 [Homalodisca vitripennis]|nr:hypothetical protein J6590_059111 [Homalodisca vitripennis]
MVVPTEYCFRPEKPTSPSSVQSDQSSFSDCLYTYINNSTDLSLYSPVPVHVAGSQTRHGCTHRVLLQTRKPRAFETREAHEPFECTVGPVQLLRICLYTYINNSTDLSLYSTRSCTCCKEPDPAWLYPQSTSSDQRNPRALRVYSRTSPASPDLFIHIHKQLYCFGFIFYPFLYMLQGARPGMVVPTEYCFRPEKPTSPSSVQSDKSSYSGSVDIHT